MPVAGSSCVVGGRHDAVGEPPHTDSSGRHSLSSCDTVTVCASSDWQWRHSTRPSTTPASLSRTWTASSRADRPATPGSATWSGWTPTPTVALPAEGRQSRVVALQLADHLVRSGPLPHRRPDLRRRRGGRSASTTAARVTAVRPLGLRLAGSATRDALPAPVRTTTAHATWWSHCTSATTASSTTGACALSLFRVAQNVDEGVRWCDRRAPGARGAGSRAARWRSTWR